MLNIKRLSLIALVLLIVGVIGSALTFKTLDAGEWEMEEKVINSEGIMNIKISTDNTKVEILPTKDISTKIELTGETLNNHLSADVEGTTLSIQVKHQQRKFINLNFRSPASSLTVYVPEKVYDSLQIKSDNGRITAENIRVDDVISETNNGRIELKDIDADTIKVKTNNGKIILDRVVGEIYGVTNNGSITLVTADLERHIELESDNGKIHIETKKEPTNAQFDVRVDNGRVRIFGESNWDTVIGNGDNIIKLTTNNGGITVTK